MSLVSKEQLDKVIEAVQASELQLVDGLNAVVDALNKAGTQLADLTQRMEALERMAEGGPDDLGSGRDYMGDGRDE